MRAHGPHPVQIFFQFLDFFLAAAAPWRRWLWGFSASSSRRKSRRTVLLHFGHLGSDSDNMTYIKHLGHPTSTIDVVASGLLEYFKLSSDDTHELGGDVSGDVVTAAG